MNVSKLRRALRLVHCLQKERGASCAVVASDDEGFELALKNARDATDIAARRLYRDIPPALIKIRIQLDQRTSTQVHRMLLIYKTLISNVEHEHVQMHLQTSRQSLRNPKSLKYQRSRSTNDFEEYASDKLLPNMIRHSKAAHSQDHRVPFPSEFIKPCSEPALFMPTKTSPPTCLSDYSPQTMHKAYSLVSPPKLSPRHRKNQPSHTNFLNQEEDRTLSLVNLLGCLVRLKESTGMQRAVISSMMGQDSHMLLTSLILEVENQRKLVAELQQLPLFDYSLQKLVQDSVTMGPQMETLQAKILKDFDLQGFHEGIQSLDVWNMITVYIDKLYALEMLLVEELEYCVEEDTRGSSPIKQKEENVMQRIFGEDATHVSELAPDVVKKRVVDFMGQHDTVPPPPPLLGASSSAPLLAASPPKESLLSGMLQLPTASESSKEWQISLDEIQFRKRVGRGNAGTTYLAKWSGQTVAVKVAALSDMGLEGWKAEVQTLQRLHHPNVIRLLGSIYNENPLTYCLVLEYCNAGDLSSALQLPAPQNFFFKVATDIANGMAYLHKRGVLHRDIKPSNVLIDGNVASGSFTAKVSDFGVATTYEEADVNRTAETGTYRWMAPEIIRHESYSLMADVYSFAILCWQLLTRENPFQDVSPIEAAGKVALELARPPFPQATPACINDLISTCWAEEPSYRLTFEDISKILGELELADEEIAWLQAPMGHAVYEQQGVLISSKGTAVSQQELQVPSPASRPPLDAKHKDKPQRASGFRRIFPKQKK